MRNPELLLNNLSSHSSDLNYKFERVYRILFNEQMFYSAYQRIYAKPGNMTPGTDGKTIDQMSIERISKIIATLKDESYQPKPAKRIYIPKKNGKMRPLGIPSFEDKLVQEVVRMVLEAIYEGAFYDTSHGFRPNRSCHTALTKIGVEFTGTKWFIEGDIKGFFDNIDHEVLVNILKKRIEDERFIRLIRKFLKAGYVEQWKYNPTYSGTPQGGIISPILANIYLNEFDEYMDKYAKTFNKGKARRVSSEYRWLESHIRGLKQKYQRATDADKREALYLKYKEERKKLLRTPCKMDMDEEYKRLRYVRYADDFLIGVAGSKEDCERMKENITEFMRESLKLELSAEKTLITHGKDAAKFLGYEISIKHSESTIKTAKGGTQRSKNGRVRLWVSKDICRKRLTSYDALSSKVVKNKTKLRPKCREYLIGKKPELILAQYNAEIRGFYNYYALAHNIGNVGWEFFYFMKYSMLMTLAQKLNTSISKVIIKFSKDKNFVIPYTTDKGEKREVILYNKGFKLNRNIKDITCDRMPVTGFLPYPTLAERLRLGVCEVCGEKDELVMHHIRKLTMLKGNTEVEKILLKRRRKTIAVCQCCNAKIQKGEL